MRAKMPVTIKEVAQAAGVSTAAVSKVLHGGGSSVRVSDQRAAVIREVAERLNYRPNVLARNLRSRSTHTVGLYFENFYNISGGPLYYVHLLDGVGSVLFRNHYRLTILPELPRDNVLDSLADGQIEGVLWCKLARDAETLHQLSQCPVPIVAMNAAPASDVFGPTFVSCDNEGGIDLAVDHLWRLGHRRILFVTEREEQKTPDCGARREAFANSLRRRGTTMRPEDEAIWGWEFLEFDGWWNSGPEHTAIICWTERAAGVILGRADTAGVRVPADLSVVGFDSTQYCETTRPRLTAVRQPVFDMARFAAETLLSSIRGETPSQSSFIFPCAFDVRESTGTPRTRS
jgi:LacI family transcriptional regulator